jgi:hypothetical protein
MTKRRRIRNGRTDIESMEDSFMHSMSHISKVPSGFLVRKVVGNKLHQKYFGHSTFADEVEALSAAVAYRDHLLAQTAATDAGKSACEVSGISGVTWCCHVNPHRPGVIVHRFRAEVIGLGGEQLVRAWSVDAQGLWQAFKQAVTWQFMATDGAQVSESEVIRSFLAFMQHYLEQARREENPLLRGGMRRAVVDMIANADAPAAMLDVINGQVAAD